MGRWHASSSSPARVVPRGTGTEWCPSCRPAVTRRSPSISPPATRPPASPSTPTPSSRRRRAAPASCWWPSRWAGSPRPSSASASPSTCSCCSTRWSRGRVSSRATGGGSPASRRRGRRRPRPPGASLDLETAFFHDVPPRVTAEAMALGEPEQSGAPFARPWPVDEWPDVPVRFLQGREDRFFPVEFQRRVVARAARHRDRRDARRPSAGAVPARGAGRAAGRLPVLIGVSAGVPAGRRPVGCRTAWPRRARERARR